MKRPFSCPTRVLQGHAFDDALAELLDGRSWVLITSTGWEPSGIVETLSRRLGAPATVLLDVGANPDIPTVTRLAEALPEASVVVALGGGSVIASTG